MAARANTADRAAADTTWLLRALERMVLIRAAEEKIGEMLAVDLVRGPCHLAIGQEATAVGVARHLRRSDRVFGAHRSHGHYLALGGSLHRLMAELQGKQTGVSRGMGGSMHLLDTANGLFGTVPIVGATIPLAVGAGLAAKFDGRADIAVVFFGDGATDGGAFHESLNLAALWRAPVLFACENNLLASHLHIDLRQPAGGVGRFAEANRIPWVRVDGNNVIAVAEAADTAISAMRAGEGPRLLELETYRWRGHVGPREDQDVGDGRKADLDRYKGRDPIHHAALTLEQAGQLQAGALDRMWIAARSEAAGAWELALRDPEPPATATLDCVFGAERHSAAQ